MKKEFGMPIRRFALAFLALLTLLTGCSERDDPQAALEAAVQRLQDNLEAKDKAAVLEQLHPQFFAQQQHDREWARRTMALLFLRHKQVRVLPVSQDSYLDSTYSEKGHTEARLALSGADGLIPDSARYYAVKLEWWRDDGEWRLARLNWQ
jgi:uncharacterized membrane protein YccC